MPIFFCQSLTWQGELTCSPSTRQWSGHIPESEILAGMMEMKDGSGTQTYVGRGCSAESNFRVQDSRCLL